jgi:hypothetical protein
MISELNHVDLAFVVDTTGSMGAFIDAARRQMVAMIQALAGGQMPINIQLAIVEYRDHPPQDKSFVARSHGLEADYKKVQKTIDRLKPDGGGDTPEAVYDGIVEACQLPWRPHSRRVAVLVGDSPPHGWHCAGDGFPNGCPCGETADSVTALCEQHGIMLAALGLTRHVQESFGKLARFTGGEYFEAAHGDKALQAIQELLVGEFKDLEFDNKVLERVRRQVDWTMDGLSAGLESARGRVSASLSRLGRRGLLSA